MRALVIVALLALTADARPGRFERTNSRTPQGRSERGLLGDSYAFMEFAPASGAGMGAECACVSVTGAKGEAVTFTRSGAAWCTKNDYSLASCATDKPRVMSGTGGTSALGLMMEEAATNSLVHARDLSQAAWVKTNANCVKTATGVDGVANSASTCTASAGNGTAIQALVVGASTRNSSLYIRRRTGTGAVEVTRDNGATWTAITSSLSSTFKRVVAVEAVGCAYGNCIVVPQMTSGIANPSIGIRLVTNGDAVDVDLVQDEAGAFPTSPITTTAAAAARGAESASVTVASFTPLVIRASRVATGFSGTFDTNAGGRTDATHFFSQYVTAGGTDTGGSTTCYAYSGAGTPGTTTVFVPPLGPTPTRCVLASGSTVTTSTLGISTAVATAATAQAFTSVHLGSQTGLTAAGGVVSQVCMDPSSTACADTATHPTAIAWVGDSITRGDAASPSRPPATLRTLLPARTTYNLGINGAPVSTCATNAAAAIRARAKTLVLLCGVNSLGTGNGAAVLADLTAILDSAKAAGMTVIPVLLTPWATAATWSAAKQTSQDVVNAGLSSWCTANGATCVDTATLGTGSPAALQAGYDSGDGLHLNAAGGAALAALVNAANP